MGATTFEKWAILHEILTVTSRRFGDILMNQVLTAWVSREDNLKATVPSIYFLFCKSFNIYLCMNFCEITATNEISLESVSQETEVVQHLKSSTISSLNQ